MEEEEEGGGEEEEEEGEGGEEEELFYIASKINPHIYISATECCRGPDSR
jgi:hypothetical protein